ncbi:MAG: hypothetical protein A2927_00830 [Candidatus Komeilibacteria bacterium RIFCSPLOWO2_01_FULL_45_10]|uniref:DUF5667 domain-containing protein n=1 Tax=Candidatus Komeilibacteria bacterium RIFCSPLOWO2_01_FULL_45_10 TaxID=1798550 RepID=A0A1G2BK35_9BACT|nr:MAG: hypothetical protein A2927_00830 [Candidatus Komeilibacteria bacterium RIFCSPLOWO2_01_FULL_45_10]
MKKILFFSILALILAMSAVAYAQDEPVNSDTAVAPAEEIIAADLGEAEPTVLPTNTFGYFFKNLGQTIKATLTFDPAKKAELMLKFANERLLEAQKLAEQNPSDEKVQAMIAKAQEKYQKLMEKAQTRVEKLKEKNDSRAEQLLDKLADRQLKHQQLMENLEEKMPNLTEEQKQKLEQLREQALERYSQFVEKVEQHKEKVRERLEKVIDNNNEQMNLRRLKIMEQLGDKLENENLKEGLIEAKEAMREKVINQLKEQATPEKIEEFKVSLENLGGEGEGYGLRVLNFLDERLDQRAVLEKTLNQFGQKLEEVKNQKVNQLKARLETATDQLRTELLKPLQSGEIHSVEVLEAVKAKLTNPRAIEALENAQEKQIEQFNRRIEKIEDPVRIEKLKEQVEERPAIKRNIQKVVPQIMNKIENRLEIRKENQDKVEPISEQPRIDEPSEAEPDETVTNEAEGE